MTRDDDSSDARLAALFAADLPPARDVAFQAVVLEALARRRFAQDLMLLTTMAVLAAVALWLVWPYVAPVLEALGQGLAPGLAALVAAGSILALTTGRILSPRS